jgi:hypothetical protein
MKLYLNILPGSAHPEKRLHSLTFGHLRAYWLQNTYLSDFYTMAVLLTPRLMACAYSIQKPLFKGASVILQAQLSQGCAIHSQWPGPNFPAKTPISSTWNTIHAGFRDLKSAKSTRILWRPSAWIEI